MQRLLSSWVVGAAAALTVALTVAGCHGVSTALSDGPSSPAPGSVHGSVPAPSSADASARATGPVSTGSGALRVIAEPRAGVGSIYQLINGARSSIDLTMYTLRDTTAEGDLAAAAKRGVDVRVILDRHFEKKFDTPAYHYLSFRGVHMTWAPSGTTYHQKTLTVDDKTSVIMTLNLNSRDYPGTRDFAVFDTRPADVAAIVTTFNADFAHQQITPPDGADLVWSPTNSQAAILAVINSARHTLAVENEEMSDRIITSALEAAARRGVDVKIVMTEQREYDDEFSALQRAGAHVRTYRDSTKVLYIHAKAVVADAGRSGEQMFVGSENFSVASLRHNRELGVRTTGKSLISVVSAVLAADYAGATPR